MYVEGYFLRHLVLFVCVCMCMCFIKKPFGCLLLDTYKDHLKHPFDDIFLPFPVILCSYVVDILYPLKSTTMLDIYVSVLHPNGFLLIDYFCRYERFLKIMILSVLKNTNRPVKFWFIKNYLSPQFKVCFSFYSLFFLPDIHDRQAYNQLTCSVYQLSGRYTPHGTRVWI